MNIHYWGIKPIIARRHQQCGNARGDNLILLRIGNEPADLVFEVCILLDRVFFCALASRENDNRAKISILLIFLGISKKNMHTGGEAD